jgi:hypothetical protein
MLSDQPWGVFDGNRGIYYSFWINDYQGNRVMPANIGHHRDGDFIGQARGIELVNQSLI